MMDFLCSINMNIGVAFMLFMCFGTAIGALIYGAGWLIVDTIRKRKAEWQPDMTVTETGVGVVEPWQVTQERDEWTELLNVFEFGGADDDA